MVSEPYSGKLAVQSTGSLDGLKTIEISKNYAFDAEKISLGAYSPISGFMNSAEIESVLDRSELPSGLPWTIPIFLEAPEGISEGEEVALSYNGLKFASMSIDEKFKFDLKKLASGIYGTLDIAHPGVASILNINPTLISGKVRLFRRITGDTSPAEARQIFDSFKWEKIAAFQTRNPPHRAHEYIMRCALELMDGVFINPVTGEVKPDDFPPEATSEAYRHFVQLFLPPNKVFLSNLTIAMRYAGPKAAVLLAIIRKNYGCTHFIVGRDMAGVGKFYGRYAAQEMLKKLDIGIELLTFNEAFHCKKCNGIATEKTCRHEEDRINISMTKIREMLRDGRKPPSEMIRPEISEILEKYIKPAN